MSAVLMTPSPPRRCAARGLLLGIEGWFGVLAA
jgi:hypothetical protein